MYKYLLTASLNLIFFGIVIIYFSRNKIKRIFQERYNLIKKGKLEAEEKFEDEEIKNSEYYEKLENISKYINLELERAVQKGANEGDKMLTEAEAIADNIIAKSMIRANKEVVKINKMFFESIVNKSIDAAQAELQQKISKEVNVKYTKNFLTLLSSSEKLMKENVHE